MALQNGVNAQIILGAKANEHGSAIGRTRPCIIYLGGDDVTLQIDGALEFKAAITPLQVATTFAGVSLRPSQGILGGVAYVEAGRFNDWPEANENREAKLLLADATGKITTSLSIPYLADAATDVSVRTAVLAYLAGHDVRHNGLDANAARMTQIVRTQIVAK